MINYIKLCFIIVALTPVIAFSQSNDSIVPPRIHDGISLEEKVARENRALESNEYFQIEVLFLYTPQVFTQKNGITGIQESVAEITEKANQIFSNSGLKLFVKSVGIEQSPISEQNDADMELAQMEQDSQVRALRNQYNADIVAALVSHTSNNKHCGVAYILDKMDTLSNNFGYQVVSLNPVCEDWVFAHELGHNLGAEHDEPNAPNGGLFENSNGYKINTTSQTYRTVMAFEPGELIPYFSSPNITYQSVAIGTLDADNVSTIEQSMGFVAAYRGDSTVELNPEVVLKRKKNAKKCTYSLLVENLPASATAELYIEKAKGGSKLLKTEQNALSENIFTVRRAKKSRKFHAILRTSDIEYKTESLVCKKRKKKR